MRFLDYLRLGWASIATHKKRAMIVVVIVGVLFGVLMAGSLLIQGIENATLSAMLRPTDGEVMVRTVAERFFCEDECDLVADQAEIRQTIARYGGEELKVAVLAGAMSAGYVVDVDVVQNAIEIDPATAPEGTVPVLASTSTLAGWLLISTPEKSTSGEKRVQGIEQIRERTLGQEIEFGGQRYFVVGILPGGFGVSDLSFAILKDRKNPLNVLFGSVSVGNSRTLIVDERLETDSTDEIWAEFDSLAQAEEYVNDIATHNCALIEKRQGYCSRAKQLEAITVLGNPVITYKNFMDIWGVFRIFAVALSVIACIVALSTYMRLVGRDTKVIALYHAMGATKRQVMGVYCTYLVMLSLLASVFALILGVGLLLIINLMNTTKLTQIFTIGFGIEKMSIWLLGWNSWILLFVGLLLLVAPVCVVLSVRQFSSKKLAQKMK